jgi:UDP-glucose 4-epimerase
MKIFLTGGAGYIGSHILTELLSRGWDACVYDNFSNSSPKALDWVATLTNRPFQRVEGEIRDKDALKAALREFQPDAVIHLAGLKAVGESTEKPLLYFEVNVQGSVALLEAMEEVGVNHVVFSSSATVYGTPKYVPQDEAHPIAPESPYGRSKAFVEDVMRDWIDSGKGQSAVILRYFNPAGAHESGRIGEDPNDIPNNLMPFISQVAVGRRKELAVFGDDYETRDGTGERDYIHVIDLARAHLAALDYAIGLKGHDTINIGTGQTASVLEMVAAFEATTGQNIPYQITERRAGDVPVYLADPSKAKEVLGWEAEFTLKDMCRSAWNWQSKNPEGYSES